MKLAIRYLTLTVVLAIVLPTANAAQELIPQRAPGFRIVRHRRQLGDHRLPPVGLELAGPKV